MDLGWLYASYVCIVKEAGRQGGREARRQGGREGWDEKGDRRRGIVETWAPTIVIEKKTTFSFSFFLFLSFFLSLSLSISLSLSPSLSLSHFSVSLFSICLPVFISSIYVAIYILFLHLYLSVYLLYTSMLYCLSTTSPSVSFPCPLSSVLSIYLSVPPSACQSVCLSASQFTNERLARQTIFSGIILNEQGNLWSLLRLNSYDLVCLCLHTYLSIYLPIYLLYFWLCLFIQPLRTYQSTYLPIYLYCSSAFVSPFVSLFVCQALCLCICVCISFFYL